MNATPSDLPARPAARSATSRGPALSPVVASATLGIAALLGVVGDALIGNGPGGLGFPLWIALIAASAVSLIWRADLVVSRETAFWLMTAAVCAIGVAWRDADDLQALDILATIGALVFAAASTHRARSLLFGARLREIARAFVTMGGGIVTGIFPLALREAPTLSVAARLRTGVSRTLRAVVLVAVLLLVFGALLRAADPIFASLVTLPHVDVGILIRHIVLSAVLAAIIGGAAREALLPKHEHAVAPPSPFFQLDRLEITAALGTLNVLFAAFVLVQLGWFFGGEPFLRERTGLTVAEYARRGFFQMVGVVALVVPLLVASRAMLVPGHALAKRHTMLALPLVGLLGVMIVSATLRLRLYVEYFGLSTDRLYPLAFMAWLGIVLVWLTLTVLRDFPRAFPAGAALSALATLGTLNVISPDRVVARVNVARDQRATSRATSLDVRYLAKLSGEAAGIATDAVLTMSATTPERLRERCDAARLLMKRWGPGSIHLPHLPEHATWRLWNAGDAAARRAVGARSAELRTIARMCPPVVR